MIYNNYYIITKSLKIKLKDSTDFQGGYNTERITWWNTGQNFGCQSAVAIVQVQKNNRVKILTDITGGAENVPCQFRRIPHTYIDSGSHAAVIL
jgi:hypothetical protein